MLSRPPDLVRITLSEGDEHNGIIWTPDHLKHNSDFWNFISFQSYLQKLGSLVLDHSFLLRKWQNYHLEFFKQPWYTTISLHHLDLPNGDDEHFLANVPLPADVVVGQEDHRLQLQDQGLQQARIAAVKELHVSRAKGKIKWCKKIMPRPGIEPGSLRSSV